MASVKDLKVEVKCDTRELEKSIVKAMRQFADRRTYNAFIFSQDGRVYVDSVNQRKVEPVKKLYKVFVVINEKDVHEKNVVSETVDGAWYDVVREVAPDAKLEDLTVNVVEICRVKEVKSCCC